MPRPALLALAGVAVLAAGFGLGFWTRGRPAPPAPETHGASPPEPTVSAPKVVVEPDPFAAGISDRSEAGFRYSGGPVSLRVRVYADVENNGVKERRVVRAADFAPDPLYDDNRYARDGVYDLSRSFGYVVVGPRTVRYTHTYAMDTRFDVITLSQSGGSVSFGWQSRPWDADVVLRFEDVARASGPVVPFDSGGVAFPPASRTPPAGWEEVEVSGLRARAELAPGEEVELSRRRAKMELTYTIVVSAIALPLRVPATRAVADADATARRAEADANPTSGPAQTRLAEAWERSAKFHDLTAAEQLDRTERSVAAARRALELEPGNVHYRVRLRDLLIALAGARNRSAATAGQAAAAYEEALTLVPPTAETDLRAAWFFTHLWMPPELWDKATPADRQRQARAAAARRAFGLIRKAIEQRWGDREFLLDRLRVELHQKEYPRFADGVPRDEWDAVRADLKRRIDPDARGKAPPPIPTAEN